ncbi:MAG: hypothetical protein CVU43_11185 [Chloroflexi bacterium HGW-Chloroflexi-5]|jgi:hypothetical protein|nr:MAG: hypothetical protein CVU43_11185 [Chloroflexi bacterium HGW-Chloroflexi-5]
MVTNNSLNLVEALRGKLEKVSIFLTLIAVGCLGLSIYIFGTQAKLSWISFPAFIIFTGLANYISRKPLKNNAWFYRLFMFLHGIQILLSLAGWIWVLYLAQENPEGRYTALVNLPFYIFILFFLLTFLTTFFSFMFSLVGLHKKRKPKN